MHEGSISRDAVVKRFYHTLGLSICKRPVFIFIAGLIFSVGIALGLLKATLETRVDQLWVEKGSRLDDEINYQKENAEFDVGSTSEFYIQRTSDRSDLIVSELLNEHIVISQAIQNETVIFQGETFTFRDLSVSSGEPSYMFQPLRYHPLDCFQEGVFDFPFSHSVALRLVNENPMQEFTRSGLASSISTLAAFLLDRFDDNINNYSLFGKGAVWVTPYNFCWFARLANLLSALDPAVTSSSFLPRLVDESLFGPCRPFINDPRTFGEEVSRVQYVAMFNALYFIRASSVQNYMLLGFPLLPPVPLPPPCDFTTYYTESKIRENCPIFAGEMDKLERSVVKGIVDGFIRSKSISYDSHLWIDFGNSAELHTAANSGTCTFWDGGPLGKLRFFGFIPRTLVFGGVDNTTDPLSPVRSIEVVFLLSRQLSVARRVNEPGSLGGHNSLPYGSSAIENVPWSSKQMGKVLDEWRANVRERMRPENVRAAGVIKSEMYGYLSDSLDVVINEGSEAAVGSLVIGYCILIFYSAITMGGFSESARNRSRAWIGPVGVLLVAIGVVASTGFSSLVGIPLNGTTTQVLPFLLLGLGVDDMFILSHAFTVDFRRGAAEDVAAALSSVGPSITLTLFINFVVFMLGSMVPLPLVMNFSYTAAIGVIFIFLEMIILFPTVLYASSVQVRSSGASVSPAAIPPSHIDAANVKASSDVPSRVTASDECLKFSNRGGAIRSVFLPKYYMPLLKNPLAIFFIIGAFAGLFAGAGIGLGRLDEGLSASDVTPESFSEYKFLKERDAYFSFFTVGVAFEEMNYKTAQPYVLDLWQRLVDKSYVVPGARMWYEAMLSWGMPAPNLKCFPGHPGTGGKCGPNLDREKCTTKPPASFSQSCAGKACFPEEICNSRVGGCRPIAEVAPLVFDPAHFDYCLELFMVADVEAAITAPKFVLNLAFNSTASKLEGFSESNRRLRWPVRYSEATYFVDGLPDTAAVKELVRDTRALLDGADAAVPAIPIGNVYYLNQQYLTLRSDLMASILYGLLACLLIVGAVLLAITAGSGVHFMVRLTFAAWTSVLLVVTLGGCVFAASGYISYFGIKLNAIPAVSLVMTSGIAIEFTAHIMFEFVKARGSRAERVQEALGNMFVPILDGFFCTIIADLMLLFSDFPFIILYFFVLYLVILVACLLCALVLLPVLLLLIGPPSLDSLAGVLPIDDTGNTGKRSGLGNSTSNAAVGTHIFNAVTPVQP